MIRPAGQSLPWHCPVPQHPSQNCKAGPVAVTRFNHEFRSPGKPVVTRRVELEVRLRMGEVHSQAQACHPHRSRKEQRQELGLIMEFPNQEDKVPIEAPHSSCSCLTQGYCRAGLECRQAHHWGKVCCQVSAPHPRS